MFIRTVLHVLVLVLQLELVLNAGIMITSIMATIYGVFGVNIPFTWNQTSNAFLPVSCCLEQLTPAPAGPRNP